MVLGQVVFPIWHGISMERRSRKDPFKPSKERQLCLYSGTSPSKPHFPPPSMRQLPQLTFLNSTIAALNGSAHITAHHLHLALTRTTALFILPSRPLVPWIENCTSVNKMWFGFGLDPTEPNPQSNKRPFARELLDAPHVFFLMSPNFLASLKVALN